MITYNAMTVPGTRKTADERRVAVLDAALEEFGRLGLHGASTDAIARAAGISQPYLFRLFRTKKELFIESVRRCFDETYETFREAVGDLRGEEALHAMGEAYGRLLAENPTRLRGQMQAYAACDDPDVCAVVREGFGRLVQFVEQVSCCPETEVSHFFATGMLINVVTMMGLGDMPEPWGVRLLEGCKEDR